MHIKDKIVLIILLALALFFANSANHHNKLISLASIESPTPSIKPLESISVPVLIYHYVEYVQDEKDTIRKSLNIIPYIFIKQIETLKNAGYTFVTMSELIDMFDGKKELPQKLIAITFDDGYRDFYTDVFPILKKYNVKVTAYIVSGFLDRLNYLFTPHLKEIVKSGLVEIGAHTVHHYSLRGLNFEVAKYEIEESKKELETILGNPIVSFAYPDGSFDEQAIQLVENAGFKSAVTTMHGFEINRKNKYSIFRLHPGGKTENYLLNFIEQK